MKNTLLVRYYAQFALFYIHNNTVLASTEPPQGKYKSDGQRTRLNKRKVTADALIQTRDELFAGEFDG